MLSKKKNIFIFLINSFGIIFDTHNHIIIHTHIYIYYIYINIYYKTECVNVRKINEILNYNNLQLFADYISDYNTIGCENENLE